MFLLWREDLLIELVEGSYYLKKRERKNCTVIIGGDVVSFSLMKITLYSK